jgi:hypothetical protein
VTHFLDKTPPLDLSDPAARDLWNLLASVYQSKPQARDLSEQAGLDNTEIDWDRPMRWVWRDVLTMAHRQARLRLLLEQIRQSGDTAVAARIDELVAAAPVTTTPTPAPDATWKGFGDPGFEKVIQAEPTFLDIAFLRRGVELGAAVCRLLVTMSGQNFYGTGFRIGEDLILTNEHVLFDRGSATNGPSRGSTWHRRSSTATRLRSRARPSTTGRWYERWTPCPLTRRSSR